jgi:hypothetical protein
VQALEENGWKVQKGSVGGKSSLRRMTKGGETKIVSIRTSQDAWIAFPRNENNTGFATLEEADYVVAASLDDKHVPKFINIHLIPGDEMRDRFDRAYAAREAAGHKFHDGRGHWLSLYDNESPTPVSHVGAGAGLKFPPLARYALDAGSLPDEEADGDLREPDEVVPQQPAARLTIAEAKRLLAESLGVEISAIKITIEG